MARFVGRQDDDIRFALGVIDDHRRLIAAGKTHRWDMVKWAVLAIAKGRPGAMPSDLGTNCRSAPVPFITRGINA
jgi:hypothetical protein